MTREEQEIKYQRLSKKYEAGLISYEKFDKLVDKLYSIKTSD